MHFTLDFTILSSKSSRWPRMQQHTFSQTPPSTFTPHAPSTGFRCCSGWISKSSSLFLRPFMTWPWPTSANWSLLAVRFYQNWKKAQMLFKQPFIKTPRNVGFSSTEWIRTILKHLSTKYDQKINFKSNKRQFEQKFCDKSIFFTATLLGSVFGRCPTVWLHAPPPWPTLYVTESQHFLSLPLSRSAPDNLLRKKHRLTSSACVGVWECKENKHWCWHALHSIGSQFELLNMKNFSTDCSYKLWE